jgi:putative protease
MAGDARMTSPTADPLVGGDAFPRIQAAPAVAALGPRSLPELFAPAGGWECARAAVENGADAIYFGLEKFNARMRADNFTEADLPKLMDFLHRRGVKGYVTLNTLVFEDELDEAEQYLRTMIAAGVDAVIVQDAGICRLIRRLSPDFPIHASTQMTVTSLGGVEFARDLGCNMVVLARECSIGEIEKIQAAQANLRRQGAELDSPLPVEVFVHGALCVAYSGQCLTSEALGGRSANRGECAQACRMPYELISDGAPVSLGNRKYLLSPQDLAGLSVLPGLIRAGVASLKIEGRLKSPEYVANITRAYRKALDELRFTNDDLRADAVAEALDQPGPRKSQIANRKSDSPGDSQTRYELEMAFSRGLHTGWLGGINNQQLVHGRFGKKRGVYLGTVAHVLRDSVRIQLEGPLKRGDGVVFDAGKPEEKEEGGRVYEIQNTGSGVRNPQVVELQFGRGDIDFSRLHVGDKVWKTSDPGLDRRLRRSFEGDTPQFQRPVFLEAHGVLDKPLTLLARDELGNLARVDSTVPLVRAEKQPLTTQRLREQLGRLGGTPFKLGDLRNCLSGDVMLPVSELNRLRRRAVAELERLRSQPKRWRLLESPSFRADPLTAHESGRDALPRVQADRQVGPTGFMGSGDRDGEAALIVLVRSLAQLRAALDCGIQTLYCDFDNPKKYRDAVAMFRAARPAAGNPRSALFVAPPRIFKTGEDWTLEQVRSCWADGYLVRNYDHLKFFACDRRIGDYSLNVANGLAADYFLETFGLERVTASYDLNFQQIEALLRGTAAERIEVTLHQHMPMFHMEHCVFCAFLSDGTDYTNCGRPCDRHDVSLRDHVGVEHPVKADAGCRNTVFNGRAQTGAEGVPKMLSLGVRHFRIEFLNESPEQVAQTISRYDRLLRGEITGGQLWRGLKLFNQLGVTRGQMGGA